MRIANGKVFDGQCFRERDVVVEGQTFSSIEASGDVACGAGHRGIRGKPWRDLHLPDYHDAS